MKSKLNICQNCQSEYKKSDIICSKCGDFISHNNKTFVKNKNKKQKLHTTRLMKTVKFSSSFLFLSFTIFFAYCYLYKFSVFYKVSDYFFVTQRFNICQNLLILYEKIALKKDLALIQPKLKQLLLEKNSLSLSDHQKLNSIKIKYLHHSYKNNQLSLQIEIINHSPFKTHINLNYFYLKNDRFIYFQKNSNNNKIFLSPWKQKNLILNFITAKNIFNGNLVFNNSQKYASFKLAFIK